MAVGLTYLACLSVAFVRPSGMIARSGTYSVRSRIIDDDKAVYADFEWQFKLAKVSGCIPSFVP